MLFSYEKENNTIKDTLEEAVKGGANLHCANLVGANLRGAYLHGANLSRANLRGADLGDANLGSVDFRRVDLRWVDLSGANLGDCGKLNDTSDILIVGPIGSRNDYTTIFHTDKGIFVQCGCFKGSLREFEAKVKETHGENKHSKDYLALIDFVKVKYDEREDKE